MLRGVRVRALVQVCTHLRVRVRVRGGPPEAKLPAGPPEAIERKI